MASFSNWNLSISSSREEEEAAPSSTIAYPRGLVEVAERREEFLTEWGGQRVEGRAELRSLAERRLYEPNDSRLL